MSFPSEYSLRAAAGNTKRRRSSGGHSSKFVNFFRAIFRPVSEKQPRQITHRTPPPRPAPLRQIPVRSTSQYDHLSRRPAATKAAFDDRSHMTLSGILYPALTPQINRAVIAEPTYPDSAFYTPQIQRANTSSGRTVNRSAILHDVRVVSLDPNATRLVRTLSRKKDPPKPQHKVVQIDLQPGEDRFGTMRPPMPRRLEKKVISVANIAVGDSSPTPRQRAIVLSATDLRAHRPDTIKDRIQGDWERHWATSGSGADRQESFSSLTRGEEPLMKPLYRRGNPPIGHPGSGICVWEVEWRISGPYTITDARLSPPRHTDYYSPW